jgi:hypothetical protein
MIGQARRDPGEREQVQVVLRELRRRKGFAFFHWWWCWVCAASRLHGWGAPWLIVWSLHRVADLGPEKN